MSDANRPTPADDHKPSNFLRQIIERRVTGEVYRETRDDAGRVVPVAVPVQAIQRGSAY